MDRILENRFKFNSNNDIEDYPFDQGTAWILAAIAIIGPGSYIHNETIY